MTMVAEIAADSPSYVLPPEVLFDYERIAGEFSYELVSDEGSGADRFITLRGVNDEGRLAIEIEVWFESGLIKEARVFKQGQSAPYKTVKVLSVFSGWPMR